MFMFTMNMIDILISICFKFVSIAEPKHLIQQSMNICIDKKNLNKNIENEHEMLGFLY